MDSLKKLKILVVDDMFVMRKIMKNTLSSLGILNILDAQDGQKAIDVLQSETSKELPFDIIISDWNMPLLTGIELLKYCRSHTLFKNIGFIMVTAEIEPHQEQLAKNEGVDLYLKKPINDIDFTDSLMMVCNKRSIKK